MQVQPAGVYYEDEPRICNQSLTTWSRILAIIFGTIAIVNNLFSVIYLVIMILTSIIILLASLAYAVFGSRNTIAIFLYAAFVIIVIVCQSLSAVAVFILIGICTPHSQSEDGDLCTVDWNAGFIAIFIAVIVCWLVTLVIGILEAYVLIRLGTFIKREGRIIRANQQANVVYTNGRGQVSY